MILNIWDKIESCKPNLTPKELEIYELLQKDPYSFSAGSAMEIAARYGWPRAPSAVSVRKPAFPVLRIFGFPWLWGSLPILKNWMFHSIP